MANRTVKIHFQPVSHGTCQVQGCQSPAKFRANWDEGIIMKLVCARHREEVDGKAYGDVDQPKFLAGRDGSPVVSVIG